MAFPRTRFSLTTEWQPNDKLSLQWKADYQASPYLLTANPLGGNDDLYETTDYYDTASYIQHDLSARYNVMDNLSLRGGVVNAFDKKPSKWLGNSSDDNFDLFGRRFFVGVNYDF